MELDTLPFIISLVITISGNRLKKEVTTCRLLIFQVELIN